MAKYLHWPSLALALAATASLALVASRLLEVSYLPLLFLGLAALVANGLIATFEDDLPGGFNNPDGTSTPPYARTVVRVGRWLVGAALVGFAVAFAATGLEPATGAPVPFVVGISGSCLLLALSLALRSRTLLWVALLAACLGIAAGSVAWA